MADILVPILIAVLVMGLLYRRFRRLFGIQKVSIVRFSIRIILAGVLAGLLILLPGVGILAKLIGVICGLVLAGLGLATTKSERRGKEWFYTPNTYIGIVIISLLLGRIGYRLWKFHDFSGFMGGDMASHPMLSGNPIGRILILTMLVYFAAYHIAILIRCRPKPG